MKKKTIKILKFSKEDIADLTKEQQERLVGGEGNTLGGETCNGISMCGNVPCGQSMMPNQCWDSRTVCSAVCETALCPPYDPGGYESVPDPFCQIPPSYPGGQLCYG